MRTSDRSSRSKSAPAPASGSASAKSASAVTESSRLALLGCGSAHGCVDGAWWPKTASLASELPDIVAVFSRWIGTVHRVVYDPLLWKTAPSRLIRHGAAISVDPYRMVNRETICLMGTHSRSAVLFVVPPSTSPAVAHRMLRLVESSTKPMPASLLLQRYAELADEAITSKAPDVAVGDAATR